MKVEICVRLADKYDVKTPICVEITRAQGPQGLLKESVPVTELLRLLRVVERLSRLSAQTLTIPTPHAEVAPPIVLSSPGVLSVEDIQQVFESGLQFASGIEALLFGLGAHEQAGILTAAQPKGSGSFCEFPAAGQQSYVC